MLIEYGCDDTQQCRDTIWHEVKLEKGVKDLCLFPLQIRTKNGSFAFQKLPEVIGLLLRLGCFLDVDSVQSNVPEACHM